MDKNIHIGAPWGGPSPSPARAPEGEWNFLILSWGRLCVDTSVGTHCEPAGQPHPHRAPARLWDDARKESPETIKLMAWPTFTYTRSWPGCALLCSRARNIYWEVPVFFSLVELFQQLGKGCYLTSSLACFTSSFFRPRTDPVFWRPRMSAFVCLHLSTSDKVSRNSSTYILSPFMAAEMRPAIEFSFDSARTWIWSLSLWSLGPINFPPAPSNPHAMVPTCMTMATGIAMIVESSPIPEEAKPTLATEHVMTIPSATLAPRRYIL